MPIRLCYQKLISFVQLEMKDDWIYIIKVSFGLKFLM